jgi:hypothetical protein
MELGLAVGWVSERPAIVGGAFAVGKGQTHPYGERLGRFALLRARAA